VAASTKEKRSIHGEKEEVGKGGPNFVENWQGWEMKQNYRRNEPDGHCAKGLSELIGRSVAEGYREGCISSLRML